MQNFMIGYKLTDVPENVDDNSYKAKAAEQGYHEIPERYGSRK